MKIIRFGLLGNEYPGLLHKESIVDLRQYFPEIPDVGPAFFEGGWLDKIRTIDGPGTISEARLGCPIVGSSKIICLGKNYREHAEEGGFDIPKEPLLFSKAPSTLNGPFDPIVLPHSSGQVDWEVELAVVIGRQCKRIKAADAGDVIAGYTVMNDVSARQAQFSDGQWFRGKSFDSFAPLGPVIVTPDELGDVSNLGLTAKIDGTLMQEGNTADLIFEIPYLVEYISRDITLMPGDIISTGTPSGVGIFRDPPIVLAAGNVVECRIDHIGALRNPVVAPP